jgi:uncharacterized protein YvpB/LysM repeat protein
MMMKSVKRLLRIFVLGLSLVFVNVSPARGDNLPDSTYISGVNGHAQSYPLSCESRSAVDMASFWGIDIGEAEFLQSLPRSDNPETGFVGNPYDAWGNLPPSGYGVHAGPVAETLQSFGLVAEAHHDISWDDLRQEIEAGRPVMVWVIGQMWGGKPVEYEAPDGSTSMVAAFEHTMILTGYSPEAVQVVDAYTGNYQSYGLSTFLKSWAVLGNMAVFASDEASDHERSPMSDTHAESYTVQPGDFLVALAKSFGTTWQELAQLNSIGYPYTIFPGQVLKLPGGDVHEAEEQSEPEPEVVKNPTPVKVVNFQARLPIIQRNQTPQNARAEKPASEQPETTLRVVVRSSTTLVSFSKSIGVDWHVLVELNNLQPPYMLHPGQVLKLR